MLSKNKALTTGEVASFCGVNFRTVIRWIEKGHLKGYKLPGRGDHRVAQEELLAFMAANEMPLPEALQDTSKRILIVDDDRAMAQAIARPLVMAGYETEMAFNGFSAGVLMQSFRPAVLTLDLGMPQMNGFEVLKFINEQSGLPSVQVLVVSGQTSDRLEQAVAAGAADFLYKPFNNKELLAKVAKLLPD